MEFDNIELNLINKISHDSIIKHICQNEGVKNVILSQDLPRIIDGIVKYSELKQHGVNKLFFLDNNLSKSPEDKNIEWIYIVRPEIQYLKAICKHIQADIKQSNLSKYPYRVLFAPRKLFTCDLIFEQEGVYEYVVLGELENDLIQLDNDVLSMEFPRFFTNYFLYGDQSWFTSIAKSLINIQEWFGTIPNVHLHGACAKGVFDLMKRLSGQLTKDDISIGKYEHKIGHLVLVDRSIDYVTPFCSPLTYEGLLDENFNINAGFVDLPEAGSDKKKRVKLSNEDKIFENIRGMHFSEVFLHLKNIVADLKNVYEKRNELTSINDLKEFINSDLKDYTKYKESVILHLNMSEIITNKETNSELQNYLTAEHNILRSEDYRKSFDYIEELINRNFNMDQALRLMILLSKTNDGLSNGEYTQLTTAFLHNYGYDKVFLLQKLQRFGLFESVEVNISANETKTSSSSKNDLAPKKLVQHFTTRLKYSTNYGNISKKLGTIPNDINPNLLKSHAKNVDISYPFNGQYRPILCRYISQMLFPDNNKQNFDEISKLFPGDYEFKSQVAQSARNYSNREKADKTVLIFFLGGCTYTEIACLKKLAQQKGYKFLFATTSFLNIHSMINLFQD